MGVLNVNLDDTVKTPARKWMDYRSLDENLLGVVLIQQYNMKKGLEMFGDQAEEVTNNELQQIHEFGTYIPMDEKSLSRENKMKALSSLMFIGEKHDGRFKAWKFGVGSKQKTFPGYVKSDWDSPTVTTDGVIITSTIEAHEGRDVVVADLPDAFINMDNSEKTLVLLKGKLSELIAQIDPQMYQKYITTSSKGEPMLYVRLSKALYGLLQSALFLYRKLRTEL